MCMTQFKFPLFTGKRCHAELHRGKLERTSTRCGIAGIGRSGIADSSGPGPETRPLAGSRAGALQDYYDYLASKLSFPFQARYPEPVGLHEEVIRTVSVVGLLDPSRNLDCESLGLVCIARRGRQTVELSLADLEVNEDDPNHELIEDYWYWFWNWR